MPRIPDEFSLGGLPSAQSGRPIATYDTTAIGRGVSELGAGISRAGNDVLTAQFQDKSQNDTLEDAKANSFWLTRTKQLRDEISTATDSSKLEETYKPQFQQAYQDAAQYISNPRKRELWLTRNAPDLEGQHIAVGDKVFDLNKTKQIADTYQQLDQLRNSAIGTQDESQRAKFIQTGQQYITGLKDAGYIDSVQEQKLRKQWTENYAISSIESLKPEQRMKELGPAIKTRDQILDQIDRVEGTGKSPTSSANGKFQFTDGTWLSTIAAHRPDLMQGRDRQAVLNLRSDDNLAREMAGHLLDDNAAVLRNQGVATSPANLYLAHFLGVNDAVKVLKAAPGAPISDIVQPASIAANKSILQGKTVGTVTDWAATKMGGVQRGAGGLVDFIPEDKRREMYQTAEQEYIGGTIEQQRQAKLQQEQAKATSDQAENEILQDLYSDKPQMNVAAIAKDNRLSPAAKQRMIAAAGRALADSKEDKTYGKGFYEAYKLVHSPEGTPGRITDPSVLYERVGPGGDLTVHGVDKLVSEINARKTPEGVAETEMKKQFLATARGQISGTDEGLHIKDPKGDELYLKFLAQALPAYDAGRKSGKSPATLLNPDSPDYVGKMIANYKRPMDQWFNDVVRDQSAAPPPAAFDASQIKTLNDLVTAYRSGKVSKAVADQMAIEKGWAVARPTPASVSVPVSQ